MKTTQRKTKPSTTASPSGDMDAFYTSEKASAGIRLPLLDPTGRETEHWLQIIGTDSEEFSLAESAARRRAIEISGVEDETERDTAALALSRDLAASLVIAWSFDQPCTKENVKAFFKKAPQVQRAVDISATNRALFYNVESDSSANTLNTDSAST